MSLNLSPTTQLENAPSVAEDVGTGLVQVPTSAFGYGLQEFHPHIQNLLKQQVEIYQPWVAQGEVRPLDDFAQKCQSHK